MKTSVVRNIAIDCRYIGQSGIGTFIENIVDELVENHPENHYLLITNKGSRYQENDYIHILETDIKPFSLKELIYFPVKQINECDAFFIPYINIPGNINIPVFSTIHDVIFWDVPELSSWAGRFFRSLFVKRAIRKSSALFTVSQFSRERILYHFKVDKPIYVIYNSIAKGLRDFDLSAVNAKEDTIVYVGNIKAHKGLKVLLEAFSKAKEEGCKSRLVLVGKGDSFRTSDTETMKLLQKTQNDMVFTGYLPAEQMYSIIARARLLVLPSRYEGFGIPPMEALFLGTQALVSDIPVLKEVYANLPVVFFRSNDAVDLKEKLMRVYTKLDIQNVRPQIDSEYNIHEQVQILLQTMRKDL